jgi:hypothetical protein
MEEWFCSLGSIAIQLREKLGRVRSDESPCGQCLGIHVGLELRVAAVAAAPVVVSGILARAPESPSGEER